jgi:hypothetical protein
MNEHVGIGVAGQSHSISQGYAAQDQLSFLHEAMGIVPKSNSKSQNQPLFQRGSASG